MMSPEEPPPPEQIRPPSTPVSGTLNGDHSGISLGRERDLRRISRQLLTALAGLIAAMVVGCWLTQLLGLNESAVSRYSGFTEIMTFFIGFLGGYVGLQRRLGSFQDSELRMIADSWIYAMIAPFVGGIRVLCVLAPRVADRQSGGKVLPNSSLRLRSVIR
jgi:hypothetical protein